MRDDEHDAFGEELSEPAAAQPAGGADAVGQCPVGSPVHDQQAEIADRLATPIEAEGDEEYDETAELYDGDEPELTAEPVLAEVVPIPARAAGRRAYSGRCRAAPRRQAAGPGRDQGQGRVHAAARPGASSEAAPGLRRHRPLGAAARDRRARPLLGAMPELDAMAERAPGKRASN